MLNKIKSNLKRNMLISTMYIKVYYILFLMVGKLPVKKNRVIFESFLGKQYSDNPRAIYEYLLKEFPNMELIWSIDKNYKHVFTNGNLQIINRLSFKWIYYMATAEYWVTNSRLPLWIPKPLHTKYIQTWHGTPLKKLGVDIENVHMPGTNTHKYKKSFLLEASKWDYLISPNAYSSEIFKRAFGFKKTIIESGYPRNDILINGNNPTTISKIKHLYRLPSNKKVIMYAPTWRDNQYHDIGKYRFDLQLDLNKMKKYLGEEYVILLRLHYLVAENVNLEGFQDFVYDCSHHQDIRELYLISDILITDYSSVFFDYAILKRPMIFFAYDIEEYRDNLRGFYFDFESKVPGPIVKTTDELIDEINLIRQDGFSPVGKLEAFHKEFCYMEDGKASERVVNALFK